MRENLTSQKKISFDTTSKNIKSNVGSQINPSLWQKFKNWILTKSGNEAPASLAYSTDKSFGNLKLQHAESEYRKSIKENSPFYSNIPIFVPGSPRAQEQLVTDAQEKKSSILKTSREYRDNSQQNKFDWTWLWRGLAALGIGSAVTSITHSKEKNILRDRPLEIQDAADKAFERNKNTGKKEWLFNGGDLRYLLLDLNDDKLLEQLATVNPEKKDVYIIDVGCSQGGWGRHAATILQSEAAKKSGKHFHILSLTGGKECDEITQKTGNVTIYQLNQVKIENIDEELSKRGFDLNGKVDLIVSRWTLRHLVDPFGTLKRMYGLLAPTQGKLLSNGFLFMFDDSSEVQGFPSQHGNILTHANTTAIFRDYHMGRDAGQFLLVRDNEKKLDIPLEYTGLEVIGDGYQCASQMVTVFKKGESIKPHLEPEFFEGYEKIYCDKSDSQCKKLYAELREQGLFAGWNVNHIDP